jgi:hypothetical protein
LDQGKQTDLQQRRNSRQISPPPAWFSQQLSSPEEKQNIYLGESSLTFIDANKKLIFL